MRAAAAASHKSLSILLRPARISIPSGEAACERQPLRDTLTSRKGTADTARF